MTQRQQDSIKVIRSLVPIVTALIGIGVTWATLDAKVQIHDIEIKSIKLEQKETFNDIDTKLDTLLRATFEYRSKIDNLNDKFDEHRRYYHRPSYRARNEKPTR